MLRTQSAQIGEQAASSTINLAQLQKAFDNIYATIDQIDSYKQQALGTMKQTVDVLSAQVEKSQAYLQRAQRPDSGTSDLALPAGLGGAPPA